MIELTPTQRRALRAEAHHLNPVVSISQKGVAPSVIEEIDRCLHAHQLIKVRLYGIERADKAAINEELCRTLACAPVQQIGNLLVLWRPADEESMAQKSVAAGRRPASSKPMTKKEAAAYNESRSSRPAPKRAARTTAGSLARRRSSGA